MTGCASKSDIKRSDNRRAGGSVLVLAVLVAVLVLLPTMLLVTRLAKVNMQREYLQNAADAAALAGAEELSKVVMNDPYWGYVGVVDAPAAGLQRLAWDNQPLPVTGINSLLASVRDECLLAQWLNSPELCEIADIDWQRATQTCNKLEAQLELAVLPPDNVLPDARVPLDGEGKPVHVYQRVKEMLQREKTVAGSIEHLSIALGWSDQNYETQTALPNLEEHKCYTAFVDYPVSGKSFCFAGLAKAARLTNPQQFKPTDHRRLCSLLHLEVAASYADLADCGFRFMPAKVQLQCVSCALPADGHHDGIPGDLVISLPDGLPAGLKSVYDLLTNLALRSSHAVAMQPSGGDFPLDPGATLRPDGELGTSGSSAERMISALVLDWVRQAHGHVNLTSLVRAIRAPFSQLTMNHGCCNVLVFRFDGSGDVSVLSPRGVYFQSNLVSDSQSFWFDGDAYTDGNLNWTISVRNQVARPGTETGGKHAGQPLVGLLPESENFTERRLPDCLSLNVPVRDSFLTGGVAGILEISSPHCGM